MGGGRRLQLCDTALAGLLMMGGPAMGQRYVTRNASGTTAAEVIFTADPQSTIRLVTLIGSSDLAASVFQFRTATAVGEITFGSEARARAGWRASRELIAEA